MKLVDDSSSGHVNHEQQHQQPQQSGGEPLTSSNQPISASFVEAILQVAIGQVCSNVGWSSIGSQSLELLTEVASSYTKSLGKVSTRYANQAGRTHVTLSDVSSAFDHLHFDLSELQDYVSSVEPHPIPFRVSKTTANRRPPRRIPFPPPDSAPYPEDTVIGYAVTDSEDEDSSDNEDQINVSTDDGIVTVKEKPKRFFKRSDYYEKWMPPFPLLPSGEEAVDESSQASTSAIDSAIGSATPPTKETEETTSLLAGLKVSEIQPSAPLTAVYLNSFGQVIPCNGAIPVNPQKSLPEFSEPESPSESESERETENTAPENTERIEKLTIKTPALKGKKFRPKAGEKFDKLIKGNKKASLKQVLSIKVSGLTTGTPTASPKLAGDPISPGQEKRIDSAIDSVLESVRGTSDDKKRARKLAAEKRKAERQSKKNQKEYSSKEFVDDDDESSSDSDDESSQNASLIEPVPPILLANSAPVSNSSPRKSPTKKMDTSVDSVIRDSFSGSPKRSPAKREASPLKVPPVTKAAAKLFPPDVASPAGVLNDTDAAKILMSISSNPVETLRTESPPGSEISFNLGKFLEKQRMQQEPSELHPFAPTPPVKTLAARKAMYTEKRERESGDDSESDAESKGPGKKVKTEKKDEDEEERRKRKEKKKKKKESRDKEKEKKKKDKKKDREKEDIPKLSIKFGTKDSDKGIKKEAKVKKEDKGKGGSCLLISETVSSHTEKAPAISGKGKLPDSGKKVKGKQIEETKKSPKGMKKEIKKKKDEDVVTAKEVDDADEEEDDGKVWICPLCKKPDDGSPMIGCDSCDEWYHYVCVGIKSEPDEDSWFCPPCTEKQKKFEERLVHARSVKRERKPSESGRAAAVKKERHDSGSLDDRKKKKKRKKPG